MVRPVLGLYLENVYAPVPGIGVSPSSLPGVLAGTIDPKGTASWSRNSESDLMRLTTTEYVVVPRARVGVRDLEDALEARKHVLHGHGLSVRELDPRTQLEGVGLAAIGDFGHRDRQVGHHVKGR